MMIYWRYVMGILHGKKIADMIIYDIITLVAENMEGLIKHTI